MKRPPKGSPPFPLPPYIEEQLQLGIDAIRLLEDIVAVTDPDNGVDSPWLPDRMRSQLVGLLKRAEKVGV